MPQPYRRKEKLTYETGAVMKRPKCAALIAAIASEWAQLESWLAGIFGATLATGALSEDGFPVISIDDAAFDIIHSIESTRVQTTVIKASLAARFPKELCEQFDDLASSIRDGARARNRVVHTAWCISEHYPNAVIGRDGKRWMVYTDKDLQEVLDRTQHLQLRVGLFMPTCILAHVENTKDDLSDSDPVSLRRVKPKRLSSPKP